MTLQAEAEAARVHRDSVRMETRAVVKHLQEILGTRLVAIISASKDPKAIANWIEGNRQPRPRVEQRLRAALQAVEILMSAESDHVVRSWFIGINPQLNDETPAETLASDHLREVVSAARAFVRTG